MVNEPRKPQPGDEEYVGYCCPPKKNQFQKGQSGNPGGKPKKMKAESDETVYEREMNRKRTVMIDGKPRRLSNRELIIKRAVDAAVQLDPKALMMIMKAEEKFGHLRVSERKAEVQQGVLVVGAPMGLDAWYEEHGGQKELPPHPLLDELRAQLETKNDDDAEQS